MTDLTENSYKKKNQQHASSIDTTISQSLTLIFAESGKNTSNESEIKKCS